MVCRSRPPGVTGPDRRWNRRGNPQRRGLCGYPVGRGRKRSSADRRQTLAAGNPGLVRNAKSLALPHRHRSEPGHAAGNPRCRQGEFLPRRRLRVGSAFDSPGTVGMPGRGAGFDAGAAPNRSRHRETGGGRDCPRQGKRAEFSAPAEAPSARSANARSIPCAMPPLPPNRRGKSTSASKTTSASNI